jgi:hypothetical protein
MSDNERGYHHRHAIDKGIAPVQHDLIPYLAANRPAAFSVRRSIRTRMRAGSKCLSGLRLAACPSTGRLACCGTMGRLILIRTLPILGRA